MRVDLWEVLKVISEEKCLTRKSKAQVKSLLIRYNGDNKGVHFDELMSPSIKKLSILKNQQRDLINRFKDNVVEANMNYRMNKCRCGKFIEIQEHSYCPDCGSKINWIKGGK